MGLALLRQPMRHLPRQRKAPAALGDEEGLDGNGAPCNALSKRRQTGIPQCHAQRLAAQERSVPIEQVSSDLILMREIGHGLRVTAGHTWVLRMRARVCAG